jgi:thiol:disulfide interchange protein DsbA
MRGVMRALGRLAATLLSAGLLFAAAGSHAQTGPVPQAGRDYLRVEPPRPVADAGKIEVIEFFYYGCPVCYELEPMLTRWSVDAPADIVLRRVPALASASWEGFARLYYSLESLGEVARLHWPVYEGFHFEGVSLGDEPVMLEWVARNGVDAQKFVDAYRSPATEARLAESRALLRGYGVTGVPTIVVDGRFVTSARLAGGTRQLMPLVDHLIDLARKERAR